MALFVYVDEHFVDHPGFEISTDQDANCFEMFRVGPRFQNVLKIQLLFEKNDAWVPTNSRTETGMGEELWLRFAMGRNVYFAASQANKHPRRM